MKNSRRSIRTRLTDVPRTIPDVPHHPFTTVRIFGMPALAVFTTGSFSTRSSTLCVSSSNFDGIADEQLEPGIPELKTWLGTRGFNLDVDAAFNARMLAFDFEAILRINGVYGRNELLFGGAVIGVRGDSQDNFMPG